MTSDGQGLIVVLLGSSSRVVPKCCISFAISAREGARTASLLILDVGTGLRKPKGTQ